MRIRIEAQSALGKFILPQGYNPYVQGLVNACIPEDIKWSGIATGTEEAHFKLFTFSQLYAKSVERIDVAPREDSGSRRTRSLSAGDVVTSLVLSVVAQPRVHPGAYASAGAGS